jgi:hypothetical protein
VNWFRRTPEHQRRAPVDEARRTHHIQGAARADHATYDSARSEKHSRAPRLESDHERSSSSGDGELTPERALTSSQSLLLCPSERECGSRPVRRGAPPIRQQRGTPRARRTGHRGRRSPRPANSRMQGSRICPPLPAYRGRQPSSPDCAGSATRRSARTSRLASSRNVPRNPR